MTIRKLKQFHTAWLQSVNNYWKTIFTCKNLNFVYDEVRAGFPKWWHMLFSFLFFMSCFYICLLPLLTVLLSFDSIFVSFNCVPLLYLASLLWVLSFSLSCHVYHAPLVFLIVLSSFYFLFILYFLFQFLCKFFVSVSL